MNLASGMAVVYRMQKCIKHSFPFDYTALSVNEFPYFEWLNSCKIPKFKIN